VLVGGVVLYPLGFTIDFGEETTYYYPSWQTGASHKASLPVKFIGGQSGKSNKDQQCWLDFQAFHMNLSCWRVMSMTKMHPQMVNWQCQGHKGCLSFQFLHWIIGHHSTHWLNSKHRPIIIFIKLGTFCRHQVHNHLVLGLKV
jgi:hypothetical protein